MFLMSEVPLYNACPVEISSFIILVQISPVQFTCAGLSDKSLNPQSRTPNPTPCTLNPKP